MNAEWTKFFRYLSALEEPALIYEGWSQETLNENIESLRSRLQQPRARTRKTKQTLSTRIMRFREIPRVYAALGTPAKGSSIEEIMARTQLDATTISRSLKEMKHWDLISEPEPGRWNAKSFHLALVDLKDDLFFQNLFLSQLEALRSAAPDKLNSASALFFTSAISVKSELLPELKKELQELMLSFVDRSEAAEGDQVINIVCGMS